MKQGTLPYLWYALILLVIATVIFAFYISLATQNHFSQLEPMLNGSAPRPYVYRVLTPFVIRGLSLVFRIAPFLAASVTMYFALIGFSFSNWALIRLFFRSPYSEIFAVLAPLGLIPFLFEQRHIYDFPTLFLFTLSLYYLAKKEFGKYILTFVFVTLSKETSLFLLMFFVVQFRNIERRKFLLLSVIQLFIYALVRLVLMTAFRNNSGGVFEFHLYDHIHAYVQFPVNTIVFFSVVILILWITIRAKYIPDFVRNSLLAIGGPALLLYFFFGVPFEVRVFLEAYPSMFLVGAFTVMFLRNRFQNISSLKRAD